MSDKDLPAFPQPNQIHPGNPNPGDGEGMTLRDYFAAKAMQALIAALNGRGESRGTLAHRSYLMADAMITARKS